MNATRGVAVLCAVLARLSEGTELTVGELAKSEGFSRSSVFGVVGRMEAAGLVKRDPLGRLSPGPEMVRLGLASFGIAALHGPAEALLQLLHSQTGGTSTLVALQEEVLRVPPGPPGQSDAPTFAAWLGLDVLLTLTLRPSATRAARAAAETMFDQVALTLRGYLEETSS